MTIKEAAQALNTDIRRVYDLLREGKIAPVLEQRDEPLSVRTLVDDNTVASYMESRKRGEAISKGRKESEKLRREREALAARERALQARQKVLEARERVVASMVAGLMAAA
jgi:transcription initiation factor IIE alpha subunit